MEEIFRYQQLRQAQTLPKEQHDLVGLLLYPDNKLSALATRLIQSNGNQDEYASIINRYVDENSGKIIRDLERVHPVIRSLYSWLDFKARPIKNEDFKKFLQSIKADEKIDLQEEWTNYADNLIIAIANKDISINSCVDFQLLIKACYVYALYIRSNNNRIDFQELNSDLLNELLMQSILLPAGILSSRCTENCSKQNKINLPIAPAFSNDFKMSPERCMCKTDDLCKPPSRECMCIRTYVSDLFIVKENIARFEAGDIAHIENILAGEKLVRRYRTLLKTEDTSETEKETNISEEKDHQVSEKFSLQSEVKNTIDSKVAIDAGVTSTLKYGESVTVTPHANVTNNSSKSESENTARSYAKEIVDRSISKIQEKVRKLQISKVLNEIEEKNKHSIDNTQAGADHRAGIYYWVNKVTHAQVFNYGKHMMFDIIVPEPAAIFKKLYEQKLKEDNAKKEPEKPVVTLKSITRDSYLGILSKYGIASTEEIHPPGEFTAVQFAFSHSVTEPDKSSSIGFSSHEFKSPQIPKGYRAKHLKYDIRCSTGHCASTTEWGDEVAVSVNLGRNCLLTQSLNEHVPTEPVPISNKNWSSVGDISMNDEEGILTLAVAGFTSLSLSISGTLSISCELTEEALEKWKVKIYNLIMLDYNRKLEIYNSSNKSIELFQIKGRNPFLNREIERNEFKRHILAILMCNYFNGMGSMMEAVAPCGYPEINFGALEKDMPIIQFFEQVFEWEFMTYLFYHSMWARKSKWAELIDEDSGDPLFDKFLMSGAARVQVAIRPGMEELFSWFLKTGQIWGASGVPPVSGDMEYVSMIQEIKESKQCNYSDRPGFIEATKGSDILKLTNSSYYWDQINNKLNSLNLDNDVDRELLIDYKIYRIVEVKQAADNSSWDILIDRPYEGNSLKNLKHAVGALFVGAPWEIVIPTKLVYLKNTVDTLPEYPLT